MSKYHGARMNKKDFESLYDCIVTGQVSPDRIAEYFKDKKFYQYWKKRQWNSC